MFRLHGVDLSPTLITCSHVQYLGNRLGKGKRKDGLASPGCKHGLPAACDPNNAQMLSCCCVPLRKDVVKVVRRHNKNGRVFVWNFTVC